jgi:hypothetical protein
LAEEIGHVTVWPNVGRIGHTGADMSAFWKGLVWGHACQLDVVFKLSEACIINHPNWVDESAHELVRSGLATLGQPCKDEGWPIRTEAVGLLIAAWYRPDILAHLTPRPVNWPAELILWDDIRERLDGRIRPWHLLTEGRLATTSRALCRTANTPQDYQRLAEELGMSRPADFACAEVPSVPSDD